MKSMRIGAHLLHILTGSKRFLAGSVLKFMNMQVEILILLKLLATISLPILRNIRSSLGTSILFAGHPQVKVGFREYIWDAGSR